MRTFAAIALIGAALSVCPALADEEKTARICAESAERYKELYGRSPTEEPVVIVTMYKYTFCPVTVTVKAGSTVRFVNIDKRTSHSFWFRDAGKPESDRLFPEETAEINFDQPGEFSYLCGPHWETHGMLGKVVVEP